MRLPASSIGRRAWPSAAVDRGDRRCRRAHGRRPVRVGDVEGVHRQRRADRDQADQATRPLVADPGERDPRLRGRSASRCRRERRSRSSSKRNRRPSPRSGGGGRRCRRTEGSRAGSGRARGAPPMNSVTAATAKVQADQRCSRRRGTRSPQPRSSAPPSATTPSTRCSRRSGRSSPAGSALRDRGQPVVLLYGASPPGGRSSRHVRGPRRRRAEREPASARLRPVRSASRSRPRPRRRSPSQSAHGLTVRAGCCSARSCSSAGRSASPRVTPTLGARSSPVPCSRHVAPAGGHDRARRSPAVEREGRRPGHDHAPGQLDHAGPRLLRRHRRDAPSGDGSGGSSTPTIELDVTPDLLPRPVVSTRRRSTSRSRRPRCAMRSSCR